MTRVAFDSKRILVTGGAGFIGGSLAIALAQTGHQVTAFDNLQRRGSELNLARLREAGVAFVHGDVRELADLTALEQHDALIECSAEPSVLAGYSDDRRVFDSNLVGAYNCLQLARRDGAQMIFLSTSRVYPIAHLCAVNTVEAESRLEIDSSQQLAGVSPEGIAEDFPLDGARTLYGTTKLAAEYLIEEYRDAYGLQATVNRCGVVAGPWQMGKVDQGVFTHWILSHHLNRPLKYIGFGGTGKQVRDLLHIDDLVDLVFLQLAEPDKWDGKNFNVGGGLAGSLSLLESTALCEEITGNRIEIGSEPAERAGDVPVYISDCTAIKQFSDWRPLRTPRDVLDDTYSWVLEHQQVLALAIG